MSENNGDMNKAQIQRIEDSLYDKKNSEYEQIKQKIFSTSKNNVDNENSKEDLGQQNGVSGEESNQELFANSGKSRISIKKSGLRASSTNYDPDFDRLNSMPIMNPVSQSQIPINMNYSENMNGNSNGGMPWNRPGCNLRNMANNNQNMNSGSDMNSQQQMMKMGMGMNMMMNPGGMGMYQQQPQNQQLMQNVNMIPNCGKNTEFLNMQGPMMHQQGMQYFGGQNQPQQNLLQQQCNFGNVQQMNPMMCQPQFQQQGGFNIGGNGSNMQGFPGLNNSNNVNNNPGCGNQNNIVINTNNKNKKNKQKKNYNSTFDNNNNNDNNDFQK